MVAGSEHTVRVEHKTASHERQVKAKTGQLQRRSSTSPIDFQFVDPCFRHRSKP